MGKKPGGGPNKQVKCDICNITLNSELQAQQHYNGKNHLKKMKQVGMTMPGEEEGKRIIKQYGRKAQLKELSGEKGEDGGETSSTSDSASNPPSPSSSEPKDPTQPKEPKTIQLQPGQAPPVNDSPSQTVTSEGEKLDPVTQAIYDNMMGKLPKKRKLEIPCAACDMVFNSEVHAEQHFKGIRHAKRLKMLETSKDNPEGKKEEASTQDDSKAFKCQHCSVSMDTQKELDEHNESIDHKTTMGRLAAASPTTTTTTTEEQNKLSSASKPRITLHSPKHDIKSPFRSAGVQPSNSVASTETSPH